MRYFKAHNPPRLHPNERYQEPNGEYCHSNIRKLLRPYDYRYRLGDVCINCGMPFQAHPSGSDACDTEYANAWSMDRLIFPYFYIIELNPNTRVL